MGDPSFPYESCQPLRTQPCKCSHDWSLWNGCWTWVYFWLVSFTLQTLRRSMLFFLGKGVVICYIDSDIVEWKNCYIKYQEAKRCLTVIYQAWDAVFYHQMKHREKSWKIRRAAEYFLTNLEVCHLMMKHCVEFLILLLKQNDFKRTY